MSEKLQESSAWDELTGGMDSHDWDKQAYFSERLESIKAGHPTWMAQNFESNGYCFVYYVEKQPVGQILLGGWATRGYEAYYLYEQHDFGDDFDTLEHAKASVEYFGDLVQEVYPERFSN